MNDPEIELKGQNNIDTNREGYRRDIDTVD